MYDFLVKKNLHYVVERQETKDYRSRHLVSEARKGYLVKETNSRKQLEG